MKLMISFLQLVQQEEFRDFVCNRLAKEDGNYPLSFPYHFPLLYRYRSLNDYAVKDILNNQFTLTSIGDFNDLYDGAMHRYGTQEEIDAEVHNRMCAIVGPMKKLNIPIPDSFRSLAATFEEVAKRDSRLSFRVLEYLGTYVICFSETANNTLMWAHYASDNQGICIEYDFNQLPYDHLYSKTLFPISYAKKPCHLEDLISEDRKAKYTYSYDVAVLCTALTKSNIWAYEKEWRMVHVLTGFGKVHRLNYNAIIKPISICFGYHFLRPFFYYDNTKSQDMERIGKRIDNVVKLLDYMEQNDIAARIIRPKVGEYSLIPIRVNIKKLKDLIQYHFKDNEPEKIEYYYVVHDQLMELLEEENNA